MNAIEARNLASKSRLAHLKTDLDNIKQAIVRNSENGSNSLVYQVRYKEHMNLIAHELTHDGYKVRHVGRLCHRAYNELEVKW